MLSFFRRYQKIIFLFTTVLIVISFGFFGTYKSIAPALSKQTKDTLLYKTSSGRKVGENYFAKMVHFLEVEPALSYDVRKILDTNPLNDGVIARDFLIQGFADLLIAKEILEEKLTYEKGYALYRHPNSSTLSVQSAWAEFAPELLEHYTTLIQCKEGSSEEAVAARVNLYLHNQRCNGEMVKQILRFKEYQEGVAADPLLANKNLTLFGYRTLSDWFGEEFTKAVAKVVIEGAELAKKGGLKVAKDELYADLFGRAESCYKSVSQKVELPVQNGRELFRMLAHRMQMEEKDLLQIWEDVLYFRRLLDEKSSSVLVDTLALKQFTNFAQESCTIRVTKMPEELYFANKEELATFELYLHSVGEAREDLLALPSKYASPEVVAIKAPELTGRRYYVRMAHLTKEELTSKVALTQLWAWQREHYEELKEQFSLPAYALFEESEHNEVDKYCYRKIIEEHPEWVDEVLQNREGEEREIFIRFAQKESDLEGISNLTALRTLLDKEDSLTAYSQDGENYYCIQVSERGFLGEILSFKEAKRVGALQELAARKEHSIEKLLASLKEDLVARGVALPEENVEQFCCQHRFYRYLQRWQEDANYREGFDVAYVPLSSYKTIGRKDEEYARAARLKEGEKLFARTETGEPYTYEMDSLLSTSSLPLDKLYMMQQLVSKDVRRAQIREICDVI